MRYRNRPFTPITGTNSLYNYSSSQPHTDDRTVSIANCHTEVDECWDVVTPNFHKRISSGEVIINPFTHRKVSHISSGGGTYRSLNIPGGFGTNITGHITQMGINDQPVGYSLSPPSYPVSVLSAAQLRALANIDKTPYSFMEDLLEMRETFSFLHSKAVLFDDLASRVARNAKRAKEHPARFLSSHWAEYRFSFLPLVRSMHDLTESFSKPFRPKEGIRRSVGSSSYSIEVDRSFTEPGGRHFTVKGNYDYSRKAGVFYRVSNPSNSWRAKYGLRNKDIPVALWNVFPLSFMYDRVFDVSSAIKALTNLSDPSITILGGFVRDDLTSVWRTTWDSWSLDGWSITLTPDTVIDTEVTQNRSVWIPSALDAVPPFVPLKDGLLKDSSSVADLLAISFLRLGIHK